MSDPLSEVSRLAANTKQGLSDLSNHQKSLETELKSLLEANRFVLTNLHHTERGVALAMGAQLDTVCRDSILAWMAQDAAVRKDAFGERGFLGSLANKIQFMYVIGIYSKQVYDLLMTIARIRNRFAHDFDIKSFSHPRIKGLVDNLNPSEIRISVEGNKNPIKLGDFCPPDMKEIFSLTSKTEEKFLATVRGLIFIVQYASKYAAETGQLTPRDPRFGV